MSGVESFQTHSLLTILHSTLQPCGRAKEVRTAYTPYGRMKKHAKAWRSICSPCHLARSSRFLLDYQRYIELPVFLNVPWAFRGLHNCSVISQKGALQKTIRGDVCPEECFLEPPLGQPSRALPADFGRCNWISSENGTNSANLDVLLTVSTLRHVNSSAFH